MEGLIGDVMAGEREALAEAVENFEELENFLGDLKAHLDKLFKIPLKEIDAQLTPMESATLHTSLAFTINSLFHMYLKTEGVDTKNHPIKQELDRVKKYIKRVKNLEKEKNDKHESSGAVAKRRVDRKAASRMIRAGMKRKF